MESAPSSLNGLRRVERPCLLVAEHWENPKSPSTSLAATTTTTKTTTKTTTTKTTMASTPTATSTLTSYTFETPKSNKSKTTKLKAKNSPAVFPTNGDEEEAMSMTTTTTKAASLTTMTMTAASLATTTTKVSTRPNSSSSAPGRKRVGPPRRLVSVLMAALAVYAALYFRGRPAMKEAYLRLYGSDIRQKMAVFHYYSYSSRSSLHSLSYSAWKASPADAEAYVGRSAKRSEERRERTRPPVVPYRSLTRSRPDQAGGGYGGGIGMSWLKEERWAHRRRGHLIRYRLSLVDDERRGMPLAISFEETGRSRRRLKGRSTKGADDKGSDDADSDEEDGNGDDDDDDDDGRGWVDEEGTDAGPDAGSKSDDNDGENNDGDDDNVVADYGDDEDTTGVDTMVAEKDARAAADQKDDADMRRRRKRPKLCGAHARKASASHPNSYDDRDALTSDSRVLISGLLTPLGMHLALALNRECGVVHIMGLDPMLPNTVLSRIEHAKRAKALMRSVTDDALISMPKSIPFVGLDPPLSENASARKKQLSRSLPGTWEADLLRPDGMPGVGSDFGQPTHIVHVASAYPDSYRDVVAREGGTANVGSPYVGREGAAADGGGGGGEGEKEEEERDRLPPLLKIRQSSVAVEQLLMSIRNENDPALRPHLVYASSEDVYRQPYSLGGVGIGPLVKEDNFHGTTKIVDELLTSTYGAYEDVYSVGLRLPQVYGPWGMQGLNPEYELVERLLRGNDTSEFSSDRKEERRWIFVDDAVDAFIAAMQYRAEGSRPVVFDAAAGKRKTLSDFRKACDGYLSGKGEHTAQDESIVLSPANLRTRLHLGWSPKIGLREGAAKLLRWHYNSLPKLNLSPHAPERNVNEETVKSLHQLPDDPLPRGDPVFPCATDCSSNLACSPSILDQIATTTVDLTKGCSVVLYTVSFVTDEGGIPFEATFLKEDGDWPVVCNLAFLARDSPFVENLLADPYWKDKSPAKTKAARSEELNGRILYRGWILVWVPAAPIHDLREGMDILKISPDALFASSVKFAVFADGSLGASSTYDDVLFVASMMGRKSTRTRVVMRQGKDGKEHKLTFPSEPERRVSVLAAEMDDPNARSSLRTALLHVLSRYGTNTTSFDVRSVKRQKEHYENVLSWINRKELRTEYDLKYHLEYTHWIDSSWVVHDLTDDRESRLLRCDWFQEHALWKNGLDQISFAHVMAMREIERKIARQEPDDILSGQIDAKLTQTEAARKDILESMTDWGDWHTILTQGERKGEDKCFRESLEEKYYSVAKLQAASGSYVNPTNEKCNARYVRILSNRILQFSERKWKEREKKKFPDKQRKDFSRGERKILFYE